MFRGSSGMETVTSIKGYELHERMGSGGFGVVHRATQTTVGREVAIKIILPHFANQPEFIRRFETEAQLIARLEHLHIVPLYDYWREPGGAYLVMRWLRGGNLRDALANGPFGLEAVALFLDQVASALTMAHHNGIVHRDLKPANILLDEDGNAYLSDFGIAKDTGKIEGTLTGTGMVLGSPDYLSPEQARSEPVTPQTDIYSLGVMLYEVLTGQHPFPNVSSVERMYKHLNEPLPLIATLPPEVVEGINTIIQKATAKNPAQRYADVLEMAADFRREAALGQRSGASIVEQLTLREQEVLQMIVEGCSNKEIAQRLFVTPATVKWHIRGVYQKLRVRSRMQAIVRARELNLIVSDTATEPATAESTYIALPEPENPYKGLRAFQMADARDFFGRGRLVQRLVERFGERDKLSRFLAVVGPSGSGKSSVVKAGLVPALWRGDLPGSERWFVIDLMPGTHPLDELEIALTRVAANQATNLREHLERDPRGLVRVAGLILPDDGSELVVIVDQFEEVFSLVDDEARRTQFLDLLYTAVTDPRSRVRVIITLRADFYDRPLHYPDFGELVRNRMETVMPLSADELEEAITKPAARVGVAFEPGLVAAITGDVHYQPGALPLLQYALTELFEQRTNRTLTHDAYQALGRATGALAKRAEGLYQEQTEVGREALRQMFLRLVTLGEGSEDTRRRVPRAELLAIAATEDLMDEAIDTYAAYRLLTLDHDPVTRRPVVEIAHEAILREWDRLRSWLTESRHDIHQQRLLAAAAAEWQQAGGDQRYLLHGARLEQFAGWAAETGLALTQQERDLLDTSVAEHERQETSEHDRQARELALQKRAANRLRYLVAGLTVFLLAAIGLSGLAFNARSTAQRQRDKAEREAAVNESLVIANSAQQQLDNGYTELALALALRAVDMDQPPSDAIRILTAIASGPGTRAVLLGHTNPVRAVAFSPDGSLGLSGSCATLDSSGNCTDGELILWNLPNRSELRRFGGQGSGGHSNWVNAVAFNPASTAPLTALSASEDGSLILWEVETGKPLRRFEGHTGGVNSVAFSPDGRTFISGLDDKTIILWDVATGNIIHHFEGHTGGVNSVAFSPDGQTFISGSDDKTIILWDVATGNLLHRFEGHTDKVTGVAFRSDPAGTLGSILSTSADFTLRYWDLETADEIYQYNYSTNVYCLALTPDGRTAAVCADFPIRLWDIERQRELYRLIDFTDQPSSKYSVAISPDGHRVMGGSADGSIRVWNLGGQPEVRRFELDGVLFDGVGVSPDGRYILTGTTDGTAILWDVERGTEVRRFEGHVGVVVLAEFVPGGNYALVGSSDWFRGTGKTDLALWNIETGEKVYQLEGQHFYVRSMAISPDGRLALTGSQKYPFSATDPELGDLILWNLSTGEMIRRFETPLNVLGIDFSADGSRAITCSADSTLDPSYPDLILWDVASGQPLRQYRGTTMGTYGVVFGPDEHTALSASGNGTLLLWDLETGAILRRFIGHEDWVFSLDFSPDGRHVISGDSRGIVILWDFATGQELRRFQAHQGTVSSVVFSPDGQTAFSAPLGDRLVIQWQVSDQSLDELRAWIKDNRYVRDLTCDERELYRVEPLCK
jgi:WD40 repeat protein/serine/threonine protein kinase